MDNGARTHDRRNHNPELYQLSYAHHKLVYLSEQFSDQAKLWGGQWGSNPRPPESQSGALPTELCPPQNVLKTLVISNSRRRL